MITASCPQCASRIEIQVNPEIGQQLRCQNCQAVLVITWLYPVCLDYPDELPPAQAKTDPQPEVGNPPV